MNPLASVTLVQKSLLVGIRSLETTLLASVTNVQHKSVGIRNQEMKKHVGVIHVQPTSNVRKDS